MSGNRKLQSGKCVFAQTGPAKVSLATFLSRPLICSALLLKLETDGFAAGSNYRQDGDKSGTWCGTSGALYTGLVDLG